MNLIVSCDSTVGGDDFGEHEGREILGGVLQRVSHDVERACLYVEDINGPRGGVDLECRCVLYSPGLRPVVVSGRGASLRPLMLRVANRAARALRRRNSRRRTTRRRPRPRLAA